ncbi:protein MICRORCHIDIA 7 [Sesamum angolense]|uniref:Protein MICRORCHIDIA 7 n=1 Tax=Sesamum angolense TaxID=2727404 RepID=A0AAE2BYP7_9LAMI|nr:protein MICRORCHIDIA 7 [Sesamum angolense]
MGASVKQETIDLPDKSHSREIISLTSSSGESSGSSFYDSESDVELNPKKKQRVEAVLRWFLDPIKRRTASMNGSTVPNNVAVRVKEERIEKGSDVSKDVVGVEKGKEKAVTTVALVRGCKQFWKAGDYEGCRDAGGEVSVADMDHVRVHPKFLHSNATSHKWALGAFAELLDNALDEVCNGATYVLVDVLENIKEKIKWWWLKHACEIINSYLFSILYPFRTNCIMTADNGGGMTPDKMRQCMSLGYSAKSKLANTIGQYQYYEARGRCRRFLSLSGEVWEKHNTKYRNAVVSFLRDTGKEDIVVPMIDYEKMGETWNMQVKSSSDCWQRNLETIVQWSPYESEEDLLQQFNFLDDQGTRIIIYNLWEDEEGSLELDLDTDQHDIQIRGANRDEKKIGMANVYSSSRHFLTYRHSLRPGGRMLIIIIADDLIHTKELVYKPAASADAAAKDPNMLALVTLGFVKDARHHIDIQGFNVYHKNRLIKPFWRVWNAAGSDGRGVIGVLEANFVEPAHDKQGFERTIALSRLEARLVHLQKNFWSEHCHLIGYAQRRHPKKSALPEKEASAIAKDKSNPKHNTKGNPRNVGASPALAASNIDGRTRFETPARNQNKPSPSLEKPQSECPSADKVAGNVQVKTEATSVDASVLLPSTTDMVLKLKEGNDLLRNSLRNVLHDLQYEKDKCKSLENQIQEMKQKMDKWIKNKNNLLVPSQKKEAGDKEEENLRRRVKEASETIQGLLRKVRILEAKSAMHSH